MSRSCGNRAIAFLQVHHPIGKVEGDQISGPEAEHELILPCLYVDIPVLKSADRESFNQPGPLDMTIRQSDCQGTANFSPFSFFRKRFQSSFFMFPKFVALVSIRNF